MDIITSNQTIDIELTSLIEKEFTNEDQKQFALNFQLYLAYGTDPDKFVVDLDNVWECIGFSRKDNAKAILIKNFEKDTDFIVNSLLLTHQSHSRGGHNKETILMNTETFKTLCMLSYTEKGKKTRIYYSKMETIFFKYLEHKNRALIERVTLESKKIIQEEKKRREEEKQIHLLRAYKDTPCIYILRILEDDENNFTIRLGETDNIENRIINHRQDFKGCVLIDVFTCNRPHKFEQYLLNRPDIKENRIPCSELLSISPNFTYITLINIIKKQIEFFDNIPFDKKLEYAKFKMQETQNKIKETQNLERIELIKLISKTDDLELKEVLSNSLKNMYKNQETNQEIENIVEIDEDSDDEEKIPISNRRVYKYNPCDLKNPIDVYFSFSQAARSTNDPKIHDYHIRNACKNDTIQSNHRWFYIDDSDEKPEELSATKEVKKFVRQKGLVAQINKEKTQIINVYPNQNIAGEIVKIPACSITMSIKNKKESNGFYWDIYDNCSDELKNTFQDELPESVLCSTSSKCVQKIDPNTNNVLETYSCIQDVCSLYKICHKTLNKMNASGDIYKGFIWKIIK